MANTKLDPKYLSPDGTYYRKPSKSFEDLFGVVDAFQAGNIKGAEALNTAAFNEDQYGSILGQGAAVGAYKKRKLEQQNMASQGIGRSQSILGGTVI